MELRGDIVKQLRVEHGWTQQHLAEVCQLNLRTIQRVEKQGNASLETIMALCVAFDCKRETLFEVPKSETMQEASDSNKKSFWLIPLMTFIVGVASGLTIAIFM